ncbi:MAG TPA: hypothetical protein VGF67_19760 [Ktedonobacteraceae bacterium]
MIALACAQPGERPISHWTGREMAEEVRARGMVPKISARHAARLFKKRSPTAFDPFLVDSSG